MKKFLFLMLLIPGLAFGAEPKKGSYAANWDIDAAAVTYPVIKGQNGSPFGGSIFGPAPIKTTGSSVTVDAVTASTSPFLAVAVDDIIEVRRADGSVDFRVVVTRPSADQITVDTAVDWSAGFSFRYYKFSIGTADTSSWIDTRGADRIKLEFQYNQGDLTSIDVRFECKDDAIPAAAPTIVYPGESDACGAGGTLVAGSYCNFTTPGITARIAVEITQHWDACRVGVKVNTDASDAGANREQVTAYVITDQAAH